MVCFWQLSGPESHLARNWRSAAPGDPIGNAKIAMQIFHLMSRKLENKEQVIDLILGIEPSGASHILIPQDTEKYMRGLSWRHKDPYPASRFASLSPIQAGRDRFHALLEDRQVVSKSTAASKNRRDNSKANHVFWEGQPRPARAAFEHGRCLWRILHREIHPQTYGLPDAPWTRGLDIISLAMNFWSADGVTFLDAGITRFHLPSGNGPGSHGEERHTWYFRSKEREVLRNSSQLMRLDIPTTWNIVEVDNGDRTHIGMKIQGIMNEHSHLDQPLAVPLVLLVHNYTAVKNSLDSLNVQTTAWKCELKELLGYHTLDRTQPQATNSSDPSQPHSTWTCSPPHPWSYAPVYVVDTMMMYKTVTDSGNSGPIRPVDVFNKLTYSHEIDDTCGGSDSNYILQSWKTMVAGTSLDEQRDFYTNHCIDPEPTSEATEDGNLYNIEKPFDLFNDGSDSEDDY